MATKVRAYIPSIGIHYNLPLFKKTRVEFSLSGGPIFVTVNYNKEINESITSTDRSSNLDFPFWSSQKMMSMDGKGTGISLVGSVKLEQPLSGSFGLSLEGGYAWQRVKKIKGNGSETLNWNQTTFSGEWGIVKEDVKTEWGEAQFIFPTNNWDVFTQKNEDFILDLSGFYVSMGLYIRF